MDPDNLIAVLFEEPEKQTFQDIIDADERCVLSAVGLRRNGMNEGAPNAKGRRRRRRKPTSILP
jgi:hypothetical protein